MEGDHRFGRQQLVTLLLGAILVMQILSYRAQVLSGRAQAKICEAILRGIDVNVMNTVDVTGSVEVMNTVDVTGSVDADISGSEPLEVRTVP